MVQKKGKGKKGKNSNKRMGDIVQRELLFREDGQDYARITAMLGDRKLRAVMTDSTEIFGIIPGKFRKRVWMGVGDVIIIAHRDFQAGKHDVVYKYNREEVAKLRGYNEIPASFMTTEAEEMENEDDGFTFGDDTDEDIEDSNGVSFGNEDIDSI